MSWRNWIYIGKTNFWRRSKAASKPLSPPPTSVLLPPPGWDRLTSITSTRDPSPSPCVHWCSKKLLTHSAPVLSSAWQRDPGKGQVNKRESKSKGRIKGLLRDRLAKPAGGQFLQLAVGLHFRQNPVKIRHQWGSLGKSHRRSSWPISGNDIKF